MACARCEQQWPVRARFSSLDWSRADLGTRSGRNRIGKSHRSSRKGYRSPVRCAPEPDSPRTSSVRRNRKPIWVGLIHTSTGTRIQAAETARPSGLLRVSQSSYVVQEGVALRTCRLLQRARFGTDRSMPCLSATDSYLATGLGEPDSCFGSLATMLLM